ncbi:MAG TPA: HAD family phosphatase [Bacteroidia bacterium]|nr:HAD family phosphatase [Bacteroidia bacterium]
MSKYKALVFDLGKVIFDVTFEMAYAHWGKIGNLDSGVVRSRFRFDEAYDLFSENKLTPKEYAKHVSKLIDVELSQEDFETGWNRIYLDVYPGTDNILIKMKKKYRLLALTNTNSVHARVWPFKYAETLHHFEKIFSSHEMGISKPKKEAYTMVLDYLQLLPGEIIFLDDTNANVTGAEDAGIKGIVVKSSSQMIADLHKEGIEF